MLLRLGRPAQDDIVEQFMEALDALFLVGQDAALEPARIEALLLRGPDGEILIGHEAERLAIAIDRMTRLGIMAQRQFAESGTFIPVTEARVTMVAVGDDCKPIPLSRPQA